MSPIETKKQRYELLRKGLKNERSSFESHWRDLADNICPRRARFTSSDTNRGDKRNQKIIDTTPVYAARTLSAGMMSGITSPARPWFRLTTPDPQLAEFGPVKQWLDDVREIISSRFLRSNLYNVLPTLYNDVGVFATGSMLVAEDDEAGIRCTPFPIGEYCLANDHKLRVRTFLREFRMTVRQMVQRFGLQPNGQIDWTRLSPSVKNAWERGEYEQWREVVHLIQENPDADATRLHAKFKPFLDCYYEPGNEHQGFLSESGYDEFPLLAARWELTAGDVYGTNCPGMTALGDIKQLQFNAKAGMQILDKINRPPMVASEGMKGQKLSILPGDVSWVDESSDKKFRPAIDVSQFRFDQHENMQAQVRARIDRAFFVDLFLLMAQTDRRQITATEIMERKEEKLLALGPMLEQMNQDVLDPLIDRTFAILERRGEIPQAPPELEGQTLKVDYVSVMAQAQKALGRSGMEAFVSFATAVTLSQPTDPTWDKVDRDQLLDEYAEMTGVPTRVVVPDEQVAEVRKARAQAAQAQQHAQMLEQAAGAAKTLSQADTSGKNALTDVLGAGAAIPQGEAA